MKLPALRRVDLNGQNARSAVRLQPWTLIILIWAGCATPPPSADLSRLMPEGLYRFDCPIVYEDDMARITHTPAGARVALLGDFKGAFTLRIGPEGDIDIVDDDMDYPGLPRTFKGEGKVSRPGHAEGEAILWLKGMGPISRNHRDGPWTLRPATETEIRRYQREQQALEQRRHKAEAARDP